MMEIIPTGNDEVDTQLGGGIPTPSLTIIEGEHGTGKTVVAAQIIQGMLDADLKVLCITENTASDYIKKMKTVTLDFSKPFLENKLQIISLHIHGMNWTEDQSSKLLPTLEKYITLNSKKNTCIVIDSLAFLSMHSKNKDMLNFITKCKHLSSSGLTIIITMHQNGISDEIGLRLRSVCDGYLQLSNSKIGDKSVKIMKVTKLIGSTSQPESQFAFDVDPVFGVKIVPISMSGV